MDAPTYGELKWSLAGFLNSDKNSTKAKTLIIKLTDTEDYNDVQDRVHRNYGPEYKMVLSEYMSKRDMQKLLNEMI